MYNRFWRKINLQGLPLGFLLPEGISDDDTFVYPLVTACYPDAIKPGEKGILKPRLPPDMALSYVRNALASLYWGEFGQYMRENFDLLYGHIYGMTQAEYEEQLKSREVEEVAPSPDTRPSWERDCEFCGWLVGEQDPYCPKCLRTPRP